VRKAFRRLGDDDVSTRRPWLGGLSTAWRRPRWLAWGLVLALLAAQTIGLAHRVAHGDEGRAAVLAGDHGPHDAAEADGGLFDDHTAGGNECRLLDQAAHADALVAAAAPPPLIEAAALPRVAATAAPRARRVVAYQARGPPRPHRHAA
jgi:hypothetical protein